MFQNFQSVQVIDKESENVGRAGHVVGQSGGVALVILDGEQEPREYLDEQLQAL